MTIRVKNILIGEGIPKICVPMTGSTLPELLAEAELIQGQQNQIDLVEWRVDFFEDIEDRHKVMSALSSIHEQLKEFPLIFTFRSKQEGGEKEIASEYYMELNEKAAKTGMADLVDIELHYEDKLIQQLLSTIHEYGGYGVLSSHHFFHTPHKEVIVNTLERAKLLGGDIPKIAVMPTSARDVLALLEATLDTKEKYPETPIITMSMAGQGAITRLSGEVFGSSVTFGALKKVSAPGQVEVSELKRTLQLIHHSLQK